MIPIADAGLRSDLAEPDTEYRRKLMRGYAGPVRTPRGRDIMAACGQLKSQSIKARASERMTREQSAQLARMPP